MWFFKASGSLWVSFSYELTFLNFYTKIRASVSSCLIKNTRLVSLALSRRKPPCSASYQKFSESFHFRSSSSAHFLSSSFRRAEFSASAGPSGTLMSQFSLLFLSLFSFLSRYVFFYLANRFSLCFFRLFFPLHLTVAARSPSVWSGGWCG